MKWILKFLSVFCLMFILGCSQLQALNIFSSKNKNPIEKKSPQASYGSWRKASDASRAQLGVSGKVIQPDRLQKGGYLWIVPFSAGIAVEASDEVDRLAMMIIRGLTETFEQYQSNFKIIFNEDNQRGDFILDGHIIRLDKPSKVKRWLLGKKKIRIHVQGSLVDRQTNQTLAIFIEAKEVVSREGVNEAGQTMGQDIARFILSNIIAE